MTTRDSNPTLPDSPEELIHAAARILTLAAIQTIYIGNEASRAQCEAERKRNQANGR
jgi:hypothetical protein